MSYFTVYSVPGSPYGRAVLATLEEKGASYKLNAVAPGTFRSEPHVSRHPFGRVPVLQHGDYVLYETQAILRYLDRVLPEPPLTPTNPLLAGRMDQVMGVIDWYFFHGVANAIVFQRVIGPRVLGLTTNEAACAAVMPKAHQVFNEFGRLLGDQPYFSGPVVSLADILMACHLDLFEGLPEWQPLTAENPNLIAWLERMNCRPSLEATTWECVSTMIEVPGA